MKGLFNGTLMRYFLLIALSEALLPGRIFEAACTA